MTIGNITFSSNKMEEDSENCLKLSKLVSLKVCNRFTSRVVEPERNI